MDRHRKVIEMVDNWTEEVMRKIIIDGKEGKATHF